MKNYVYAYVEHDGKSCILESIQNPSVKLWDDHSLKNGFPSDAQINMNADFGSGLIDVLKNSNQFLIVSEPLRSFLEKENLINNEFLPLIIGDKKGKPKKESYFIVYQTNHQDCIDLDNSIVEKNPLKPEIFIDVESIAIDESKIPSEVAIFRPKGHPGMLIVKRDLADRITEAGFSGIEFGEIDQYDQFQTL